jgi:hypothetical protein
MRRVKERHAAAAAVDSGNRSRVFVTAGARRVYAALLLAADGVRPISEAHREVLLRVIR